MTHDFMRGHGLLERRKLARNLTINKLLKLRQETPDDAAFGALAGPLVDKLAHDLAAINGSAPDGSSHFWTADELAILIDAYERFDSIDAPLYAAMKLMRSHEQIKAQARNRGLRGRGT